MKAHLRYVGPGSDKTWMVEAFTDRIEIRYGRTGRALRSLVVPQSRFAGRTPQQEARRRTRAKLAEGYEPVTASPLDAAMRPDEVPPTWPTLHVTVQHDADRDRTLARLRAFGQRADEIAARLREGGLKLRLMGDTLLSAATFSVLDTTYVLALAHTHDDVVRVTDEAGGRVDPAAFFGLHAALSQEPQARRLARQLGLLPEPAPVADNAPLWFY